ncbi:MAG: hypothetical protein U0795_24910 [Pirellulales bacterium]
MAKGVSRTELAKDWDGRLSRFQAAGQTVATFCAAEGVSLAAFYYHRRQRQGSANRTARAHAGKNLPVQDGARLPAAKSPGDSRVPLFRQVQVTGTPADSSALTIRLRCGTEIVCPAQPELVEQVLGRLLSASQVVQGAQGC